MEDHLFHYRARCVRVVDGDTFDLVVDCGFQVSYQLRVRLALWNAPELKSVDPAEREKAAIARETAVQLLMQSQLAPDLGATPTWPLIIESKKAGGVKDAYGRYLAKISFVQDGAWADLGEELFSRGRVKKYEK